MLRTSSQYEVINVCRFNIYGAQNEAYKCLLAENVANGLCFS